MNKFTNNINGTKKTRLLHIDFLRILCIFLVMFTHTSTSGFSLYLNKIDSMWFPLYILIPFWVKTAVPIFFMISGALLLKKEESISLIFKKRIWRFTQVLIIFSFINYFYNYRNLNLSLFSSLLYSQTLATAYYFLYIYLSFLLMLPIWRALVKNMTNKLFLYLIALNLFFVGFIPIFSFLIFKGTAEINWFINPLLAVSEPSFYFITGYWIEHILPEKWITKKNLVYLFIIAICGTIISASMTYYHGLIAGGLTESISERFYDSFLFLNTTFVYCTCKWYFKYHKISEHYKKILISLSSLSFGVMLFDDISRRLIGIIFDKYIIKIIPFWPLTAAFIWILGGFLLGCFITYIIKKIPYFQKII